MVKLGLPVLQDVLLHQTQACEPARARHAASASPRRAARGHGNNPRSPRRASGCATRGQLPARCAHPPSPARSPPPSATFSRAHGSPRCAQTAGSPSARAPSARRRRAAESGPWRRAPPGKLVVRPGGSVKVQTARDVVDVAQAGLRRSAAASSARRASALRSYPKAPCAQRGQRRSGPPPGARRCSPAA